MGWVMQRNYININGLTVYEEKSPLSELITLNKNMSFTTRLEIALKVLQALDKFYESNAVHGRLNTHTVSYNPETNAVSIQPPAEIKLEQKLTMQFDAPDVRFGGKPNKQTDIFSIVKVVASLLDFTTATAGILLFDKQERKDDPVRAKLRLELEALLRNKDPKRELKVSDCVAVIQNVYSEVINKDKEEKVTAAKAKGKAKKSAKNPLKELLLEDTDDDIQLRPIPGSPKKHS